ncbi:MAG: OmpA family protein [Henriciella sp.]|nr:OmpA family protein [Henriciella sp.]
MAIAYSSRRITGRRPAAPARKMGTWKLAYADFLTALCAFFLVMWVVHGVPAEDKAELAQQFSSVTEATEPTVRTVIGMTAMDLAAQLRSDPGLLGYGSSVTITAEPDLIRIDLTDMATRPLFEVGDGAVNETGIALTRTTGTVLAHLPDQLRLEGHTDSNPSLTAGYSNWELSADRANSARRILEDAGVAPERVRAVSGLADTRPLRPATPTLPANRRISIVLVIGEQSA